LPGFLSSLVKAVLEGELQTELTDHLAFPISLDRSGYEM